eukprot:c11866_g1_i2.p1 GENE.c11866_g1_i2~~c11866_g1_i2.p1  ORF type:complete len:628 (-),score=112.73 c11866_g1_i2:369-2207(-)
MDPTSAANLTHVRAEHLHLALSVDFAARTLTGHADVTLRVVAATSQIILDTRDLTISAITCNGTPVKSFVIGAAHGQNGALGQPLTIELAAPLEVGSAAVVRVAYRTSPEASAAQWLEPAQTAGKKHPYLFTQCQAIHARSLFPCQDSPSVKITYSADITTQKPLRALMSAIEVEAAAAPASAHESVFSFAQRTPIPSYLIALVVGALESRDIGPRSRVWSEAEVVETAAWEFAETETYIAVGERLVTPYSWGRYDLLLCPPSFAYGGMENTNLVFLTPTLLAGDRTLTNVVAHEISHSWHGNLVTNALWSDFWINEGMTVYLERLILGEIHGEPFRQFEAYGGWMKLRKTVEEDFGAAHPYTVMVPDLSGGVDPDDVFSSVPYEKGFAFMFYIEGLVGGRGAMSLFLKDFVGRFANRTISSEEWRANLLRYFADKVPAGTLDVIDWATWFNAPGMPPVSPKFDMSLLEAAQALSARWAAAAAPFAGFDGAADMAGWQSHQKVEFLTMVEEAGLSHAALAALDATYGFTATVNAEIRFAWCMLCIKGGYEAVLPTVVAFVKAQGRMKYVRPLYRALARVPWGRAVAEATFASSSGMYMSMARKGIAKDLSAQ